MKALVVFTNDGFDHFLSKMLKPGFRHCWVAIKHKHAWIEVDGSYGIPKVRAIAPPDFDLDSYYRDLGLTVVRTKQRPLKTIYKFIYLRPLVVANCVGLTMLILGMTGCISTPYALYKKLMKERLK